MIKSATNGFKKILSRISRTPVISRNPTIGELLPDYPIVLRAGFGTIFSKHLMYFDSSMDINETSFDEVLTWCQENLEGGFKLKEVKVSYIDSFSTEADKIKDIYENLDEYGVILVLGIHSPEDASFFKIVWR